jgi:predicted nuclease with TOPRIM domain
MVERDAAAKEVEELRSRLEGAASEKVNWTQTLERVSSRKSLGEEKLADCKRELERLRRARISDLLRWIFPITEKEPSGDGSEPSVVSV